MTPRNQNVKVIKCEWSGLIWPQTRGVVFREGGCGCCKPHIGMWVTTGTLGVPAVLGTRRCRPGCWNRDMSFKMAKERL